MQIHQIAPLGFASNCYLLTEDDKNAVAIDPAQPRVLGLAEDLGLTVRFVLLTHGHFDHIGGVSALQKAGARVGCLAGEKELALHHNLGDRFLRTVPPFSIDFTFSDGDVLPLCGMQISVMGTPGHTAGSCCFLADGAIFSGDTLFCAAVGRTDLPTGSASDLENSLRKLCALEGPVYAGHGENTTLSAERSRLFGTR